MVLYRTNVKSQRKSPITYRVFVPSRRGVSGSPREIVGDEWPHGDAAPRSLAWYAQEIAKNLEAAVAGKSLREVGRQAELDHTTISAVISGDRWADLVTLAKLEVALGGRLWPE